MLGTGAYEEMDVDTARSVLAEVDRFARTQLADSYAESDRNPPVYDPVTRTVTTSEAFRRSFGALMDAEWFRLQLPTELGGQPTPPSVQWAIAELLLGANPAAFFYAAGPNFAHAIWRNGTPDQQRIAEIMIERRWGATMVLTEPDAGSDVGAGRTRARQAADGTWHIEGVKRFITSGEWDWPENIVHLVLARPEGVDGAGGPGTKGLSLFVVPKYRFDFETGELGARNGVYATNLEHKMGLRASATCELTFGADEPAVGYLLGDVHDGIRQMFQIIEYARMMVGTKAMATLSSGYLHALAFAKERVQGGDLASSERVGPRIPIIGHPDVRRQLMTLKAHAEGLRALVLYTASIQDDVAIARRPAGPTTRPSAQRPAAAGGQGVRLRAVVRAARRRAPGARRLGLPPGLPARAVHPRRQDRHAVRGHDRDPGPRPVLPQDAPRPVPGGHRARAEIQSFVKGDSGSGALAYERELLGQALEDVQGDHHRARRVPGRGAGRAQAVYRVGQNTTRLLLAVGDLVVGWLLLREAEVALGALDAIARGGRARATERAFYEGKVAGGRYFAREVLPRLGVERALAERTDNAVMELAADAF